MSLLIDFPVLAAGCTSTVCAGVVTAVAVLGVLFFCCWDDGAEGAVEMTVPIPAQARADWTGNTMAVPTIEARLGLIGCYRPADGVFLGTVPAATHESIDEAVKKAANAQEKWAETTFGQRRKVLRTLLRHLLDHQDVICRIAAADSGKTDVDASFGDVLVTAEKLEWTIRHGEAALRPSRRPTNRLMQYKHNEVVYEPLGVVAACVSWNYPCHNLLSPIIAAVFAGNGIVVKPSELTGWSSDYFIRLVKTALDVCGHDSDLVQLCVCLPETADYLTAHAGISHITFIGSRAVGKLVAASAATVLTPVCAELGGKDAAIVLDSAVRTDRDVARVAAILMRGTFQAAGQNCIGIERIIATPVAYSKLLAVLPRLVDSIGYNPDDRVEGCSVGAIISTKRVPEIERLIKAATTQGASIRSGTGQEVVPELRPHRNGHYFSPTLLVDVISQMEIARTELFAPVMVCMQARDPDMAIELANGISADYALGASVFGHPSDRAVERVVRRIKAGMVAVNDFGAYYAVGLPFGGVAGSGYGRFGGEEGLRGLSNVKAVTRDRCGRLVQTSIPVPLQLPYRNRPAAFALAGRLVEVGYRPLFGRAWWNALAEALWLVW